MIRYHEATDSAKVAEIAASIEADGWQGAPLVISFGDELLTGAHRHTAWVRVFGDDYDIPTIELREVFEEAGLDFDAIMDEELAKPYHPDLCIVYACEHLPQEIRDAYGIDVH